MGIPLVAIRCHFSGISLEWSLVSKDSVLVGWKARVSQPCPSSQNYSALRHSLPGPVAFHAHMCGLIIQQKLQAMRADFLHLVFSFALLCHANISSAQGVCCTCLCPLSLYHSLESTSRRLFPSLKVQNLVLPVTQCLKTFVSYMFSSVLPDCGGRASSVLVTPCWQR